MIPDMVHTLYLTVLTTVVWFVVGGILYMNPLVAKVGFLLCGVRIIPRCCDMWMQTSYPDTLRFIELVNGVILSVVIALMISLL